MISVALIEDNRLVREGITSLLSQTTDFAVVAAAQSADLELLRGASPHVILLDIGLQDSDSLAVAESIMTDFPDAKLVMMDLLPIHEELVDFVNAGVAGFVMKDATFDELVSTIRTVANGEHVLPPKMTSSLFTQIAKEAIIRDRTVAMEAVRMTQRETEVIALIGEGLSNKEIADRLEIATHTVKSHVRNVMEKLALHTRLQIAAFSHRSAA